MSAELYDQFAANNRIDQAITEAEAEFELTGEAIDAKTAFDELEKKQGEEESVIVEHNGYKVLNYTPFSCSQNIVRAFRSSVLCLSLFP